MDIRVIERDGGAVNIFTGGGNLLLDETPVEITFDARSAIDASSVYNTNPALRGVGTISLVSGGTTVDLIAAGAFQSGLIGGYLDLRDTILTQTQAQLDEIAAGLALALSETTVSSTPVTAGAATGFEIDTSNVLPGNQIHLNYTLTPPGTPTSVTIVAVNDPSVLPLANSATADPNDTVIGIDFSQPMAGIVADLTAALPGAVVVSNPAGNTLRFLDDGAGATSDINSLSATITPSALADSGTGLPLFVDGLAQITYSGSLDGIGQKTGFAGRIRVNDLVIADDTSLVVYQTSPATLLGDPTRPSTWRPGSARPRACTIRRAASAERRRRSPGRWMRLRGGSSRSRPLRPRTRPATWKPRRSFRKGCRTVISARPASASTMRWRNC